MRKKESVERRNSLAAFFMEKSVYGGFYGVKIKTDKKYIHVYTLDIFLLERMSTLLI